MSEKDIFTIAVLQQTPEKIAAGIQDKIIACALACLEQQFSHIFLKIPDPLGTIAYLLSLLRNENDSLFGMLFLNNKHYVLGFEKFSPEQFKNIHQHFRQVAQQIFYHNAAFVILVHKREEVLQPTEDERQLTQQWKEYLNSLEVGLLDHFFVSSNSGLSLVCEKLL